MHPLPSIQRWYELPTALLLGRLGVFAPLRPLLVGALVGSVVSQLRGGLGMVRMGCWAIRRAAGMPTGRFWMLGGPKGALFTPKRFIKKAFTPPNIYCMCARCHRPTIVQSPLPRLIIIKRIHTNYSRMHLCEGCDQPTVGRFIQLERIAARAHSSVASSEPSPPFWRAKVPHRRSVAFFNALRV